MYLFGFDLCFKEDTFYWVLNSADRALDLEELVKGGGAFTNTRALSPCPRL